MTDGKMDLTMGEGPNGSHDQDRMSAEQIQQLVHRSVHTALAAAMTTVNDTITRSVSMAISQSRQDAPIPPALVLAGPSEQTHPSGSLRPGKSARKSHHCTDTATSAMLPTPLSGGHSLAADPLPEGSNPFTGKRPSAREEVDTNRVKRSAKRIKPDSYVDRSDSESESVSDDSEHSAFDSGEDDGCDEDEVQPSGSSHNDDVSVNAVLDSQGVPFFDPEAIKHPRSGEWTPIPQVAKYIEAWLRKPLDRGNRNKLRSECPRPSVANKVAVTPELDPILVKYLLKSGKNPSKGLDRSFKSVQDKLLDLLGPLTKILNMAEQAVAAGTQVDAEVLRGWALRATCLLGNANTAMSSERRRSVLMRLDPQLTHLATEEPGPSAEGLLFGDSLIKNINKFVGLFSSLDKAQSSLKKSAKVFGKAGRGRGRPSGRGAYFRPHNRGPVQYVQERPQVQAVAATVPATPFFPSRSRPWRARGGSRGFPRGRSTGY
ncbi:uncharacterized protein LOC130281768 [Hyla sarda]|uniref:uncharacterized protein LOC130281768 n=1 Tax=Hyla sarda TaxID=327740 RepID=UPI0024C35498|nr:uncharacterized protein LOC130281768 [Hyla sarda]